MVNATGIWVLITPYSSLISSIAAGTILKLAPIGVSRVPQYPAVIANAPIIAELAPWLNTKGAPTPTVITEKAAKA